MNRSTPGLPVHHQLPEFTQTHVHWVSDAIQPSHPLSSPSSPALNLSQHQFSSVHSLNCVRLFATPWTAAHQASHPKPTPGICLNSCPLSQWCHPNISSSVVRFSSCPQSFPEMGSFQMSQFFASGGQSIGVSASTSVLPMLVFMKISCHH